MLYMFDLLLKVLIKTKPETFNKISELLKLGVTLFSRKKVS